MATDAIRRAVKKYDAETAVQFHLKLNKKTDAEIIAKLKSVEKVQTYLKELIAADIERGKVGRWIPARIEYIDSKKYVGYKSPVYIPDESMDYSPIVICSLCGAFIETKDSDDYCSNCHHKMTPFSRGML